MFCNVMVYSFSKLAWSILTYSASVLQTDGISCSLYVMCAQRPFTKLLIPGSFFPTSHNNSHNYMSFFFFETRGRNGETHYIQALRVSDIYFLCLCQFSKLTSF